MNNKIGIIGIIGTLILIIAISGCTNTNTNTNNNTSTPQTNNVFKQGNMSFDYPANFQTANQSGNDIISGGSGWETVKVLDNNEGIAIQIQKFSGSQTPAQSVMATEISVKNNNGTILSTTNQTNPNGVKINGDIHTLTNPEDNTIIRYYEMSFVANGKIYFIQVFGNDNDNSNILKVKNIIYNSLKVS